MRTASRPLVALGCLALLLCALAPGGLGPAVLVAVFVLTALLVPVARALELPARPTPAPVRRSSPSRAPPRS